MLHYVQLTEDWQGVARRGCCDGTGEVFVTADVFGLHIAPSIVSDKRLEEKGNGNCLFIPLSTVSGKRFTENVENFRQPLLGDMVRFTSGTGLLRDVMVDDGECCSDLE